MDQWVLSKTLKFNRYCTYTTFDFKGEIVEACGIEWEVTFKYVPFFEVSLGCHNLNKDIKIHAKVHHSWYVNRFSNEFSELEQTAIPQKSTVNFKFNLKYPDINSLEKKVRICGTFQIEISFYHKNCSANLDFDDNSDSQSDSNKTERKSKQDVGSKHFPDDISINFQKLLEEGKFSDTSINCDGEVFRVHKAILSARSEVFDAMFQSNLKETQSDTVDVEDVEPEAFRVILSYIYSGKWNDESHSVENLYKILAAANKYMLSGLKLSCVEVLQSFVTVSNALDILVIADLYDEGLKEHVLKFVCSNYNHLKNSPQWKSLKLQNPHLIIDILEAKTETQQ